MWDMQCIKAYFIANTVRHKQQILTMTGMKVTNTGSVHVEKSIISINNQFIIMSESNQMKIESSDGQYVVSVGKVKDGSLNLITNFNVIIFMNYILLLASCDQVNKITSIRNYEDDLGGISLEVSQDFDYDVFLNDLVELLEISLV